MTAGPLHPEAVLDDAAVQAERHALIAELDAERFGLIRLRRSGRPYAKEVYLARLLGRVAWRAREIAERERCRCAGGARSVRGSGHG